jgi:drug/metabolite transporter (DMT)-like permease
LSREKYVALGETMLTAVLWGTSFPIITVGLGTGVDPVEFAFLRFAAAAPVLLLAARALNKRVSYLFRLKGVWVIAFFNAVGFFCQFVGQTYTDPSVAALLVNLSVILAAVGSAAFLKEKLGPFKSAGVVLAVLGTFLVSTNGDLSVMTRGELLGDSLYLVAAFAWAGYIVYNKKMTDARRWDPLAVTAAVVGLTALFLLPGLVVAGGFAVSPTAWEIIVYMALFNTAVPFILYQRGLRFLSATSSAVVLMLEIITAIVISAAFLGESLGAMALLGALLVLVSILMVSGIEVSGKTLSVNAADGRAERAP